MNFEQIDKRNNAILSYFEDWKKGEAQYTLTEFYILAGILNTSLPKCFECMEATSSPTQARICTKDRAKMKTIFNTLKKIAKIEVQS